MRALLQRFRRLAVSLLYYSGLLWIYAAIALRGRAVVLTYHRVLPRERQKQSFSHAGIVVTPETFERHMRFLRRFMRPVSATEFLRLWSSREPMPARTCLVTFDDGWYDNLEFALPILQRHAVPAVLFVATDYLGTSRCFWQEELARLIYLLWRQGATGDFERLGIGALAAQGEDEVRPGIARFVTRTKDQLTPPQIAELLAQLRASLERNAGGPAPANEDRFLSWEQAAALSSSGIVEIGSHAMSHTPLNRQPLATTARELVESRRLIRERLGGDPVTFAYPNGDFDDATVEAVRQAGYDLAFTTRRGTVSSASDAWRLERINIHEAAAPTAAALFGRITGLA